LQKDYAQLDATRRELDRNEELTEADKAKRKRSTQLQESIKSFNKQLAPLNRKKEMLISEARSTAESSRPTWKNAWVERPVIAARSARNCRPRQRVGA